MNSRPASRGLYSCSHRAKQIPVFPMCCHLRVVLAEPTMLSTTRLVFRTSIDQEHSVQSRRHTRLQNFVHDFNTFFDREQRRFLCICQNRDDYIIEKAGAALDDVDMAKCQRVERSGINGSGHASSNEL